MLGLEHACSRLPHPGVKMQEQLDKPLFVSVVSSIECWASDAAKDEQLAARELTHVLAGPSTRQVKGLVKQFLPNLKVATASTNVANKHC